MKPSARPIATSATRRSPERSIGLRRSRSSWVIIETTLPARSGARLMARRLSTTRVSSMPSPRPFAALRSSPRARRAENVGDRCRREAVSKRTLCLVDHGMDVALLDGATGNASEDAAKAPGVALAGLDHVENGNASRRPTEGVAATAADLCGDDAGCTRSPITCGRNLRGMAISSAMRDIGTGRVGRGRGGRKLGCLRPCQRDHRTNCVRRPACQFESHVSASSP